MLKRKAFKDASRLWKRNLQRLLLHSLGLNGASQTIIDQPKALGLDLSHAKLRWLRAHHEKLVRAAPEALPFADGSFSAVVCAHGLQSSSSSDAVLAEAWRVLKADGVLAVTAQDHGRWTRSLELISSALSCKRCETGLRSAQSKLEAKLRLAGFVVKSCYHFGFHRLLLCGNKLNVSDFPVPAPPRDNIQAASQAFATGRKS